MGRSIHVRLDDQAEAALGLVTAQGLSDSEAVRVALREAAERRRTRAALADEARRLAKDPVDRAEAAAILAEMDDLAPDELA